MHHPTDSIAHTCTMGFVLPVVEHCLERKTAKEIVCGKYAYKKFFNMLVSKLGYGSVILTVYFFFSLSIFNIGRFLFLHETKSYTNTSFSLC